MDIDKILEDRLSKLAIVEEPTFEEPLFKKDPEKPVQSKPAEAPEIDIPEKIKAPEPTPVKVPEPALDDSSVEEVSSGDLMNRSMSLINELIAYAQSGVSSADLIPVLEDLSSRMNEVHSDLSVRKVI